MRSFYIIFNKNHKQNPKPFSSGFHIHYLAVSYSHMGKPHTYHRRIGVSLLSSVWGQVGPPLYRRQDYSFNNFFYLFLLTISSVSQPNKLIKLQNFSLSSLSFCLTTPKTLERCIVKPLGQLVSVSSTARTAYTPDLSTS